MLRNSVIAFACLVLLATGARAFDVPAPRGHVNDVAGLMPADTRSWLEGELNRIAHDGGLEVAVLTVKTLGGETPEAAAQQVFDAWKMGRKGEDRGLLFLVSSEDRKTRIQPGYGLEAQLPDGKCGAILDEQVVPRFRTGDWAGGIVEGLRAALAPLGVVLSAARAPAPRSGGELSPLGALALIAVLVLVALGCAISPTFRLLILELLLMGVRPGGGSGDGGGGGFGGGSSGGGGASRGW